MNRRLKIVFTLSVLLNVLLIGVVAGAAYKRMDDRHVSTQLRDPGMSSKMARAMLEARKGQKETYQQMREARQELGKILSDPDFNEEKFIAASEKVNQAQEALFKARSAATLKIAKESSVEERQEMVRHMKSMSERHERLRDRFADRQRGDGARSDSPAPQADQPPPGE